MQTNITSIQSTVAQNEHLLQNFHDMAEQLNQAEKDLEERTGQRADKAASLAESSQTLGKQRTKRGVKKTKH